MSAIVRSIFANSDLIDIWLHIATESVNSADRVLDRIEQMLDRIAKFPLSGRERPEIAPEVRLEVAGDTLSSTGIRVIESTCFALLMVRATCSICESR